MLLSGSLAVAVNEQTEKKKNRSVLLVRGVGAADAEVQTVLAFNCFCNGAPLH